ncbi:MAG: YlxR family protein [Clostridiales bacterium]|nr:YlxR family protein [Clostridiales bacterium]
MRRCIGCMESKPKDELVRIAYYEGDLTVDASGRAKGRGVYLCRNAECMELAQKKNALQRNFKTNFDKETINRIFEELRHVE